MTNMKNRLETPTQYLRLFLTGVAMGSADVVPGVSGGTMAFILGIYADLLNAIKSFTLGTVRLALQFRFRELLQQIPWQFLVVLGSGIVVAIATLARGISWLLIHEPVLLFSLFFGLILASILAVGARLRWSPRVAIALVLGSVGAYLLVGMVPLDMPNDPLTLFLSGMVAIMAMILPGISGSFILLILGQYEYVLNAVIRLDVISLAAVGMGAVIGLLSFTRVLSWLLARYEQPTVAALVGFMIGSLRVIWPWKVVLETRTNSHGDEVPLVTVNALPAAGSELAVAIALCAAGFLLVSVLDHLQSRSNPLFRIGRRAARGASDGVPAE